MALKMAYSPTLVLQESYVALYKIYILKNPFTREVFYVGQTLQELNTRLTGHIHESGDVNAGKNEYIKGIIREGGKPIIEAVETIAGTCRIDKALVNNREIYWIKYYKSIGTQLLNIAITHDEAECREYQAYLRSIKAGEGEYRYYFCGRTHGGHEVYDEKKMRADGFRLPAEESSFVKIVEKEIFIDRIIEKIRYIEKPTVKTETFPPQPGWTKDFLKGIPFNDIIEDMEFDDYEGDPDMDLEEDNY